MTKEKEHIRYFDYLRLFAMLAVIFMHVAAGPLRSLVDPLSKTVTADWHILNVITGLAFTAVPFFFMMSGYLLLASDKTLDISVLFKKRLPRLFVPLAGWTVIAVLWYMLVGGGIDALVSFDLELFWERLVAAFANPASTHFWYMYTLIAIYAISPFLRGAIKALDKAGHIYLFCLCALISVHYIATVFIPEGYDKYVGFDIINKLTVFSGHLSTFIMGYYLGSLKKKISNILLLAVSLVTLGVIIYGTYSLTVESGEYVQTFQVQSRGFEVLLAACIFLLFKQNLNKKQTKAKDKLLTLTPVISLSLAIYLMHNILISMMVATGAAFTGTFIGPVFDFSLNGAWDVVRVTLVNFVICFFTMKTVATIPVVCYIATGVPFKEACNSCNWIYTFKKIKASFGPR